MVAIAQLVERRLVVPDVAGSSPVGHPWNKKVRMMRCRMQNEVHWFSFPSFCILHSSFCISYVEFKRIIPCLDVDKGRVVKGVKFFDHVDAGDPVEQARRYQE